MISPLLSPHSFFPFSSPLLIYPLFPISFLVSCMHYEYKRVLGRKVMTNLDSILKSRDITLPTKVHLGKAMVFLVVMYGCESWTIKKSEH